MREPGARVLSNSLPSSGSPSSQGLDGLSADPNRHGWAPSHTVAHETRSTRIRVAVRSTPEAGLRESSRCFPPRLLRQPGVYLRGDTGVRVAQQKRRLRQRESLQSGGSQRITQVVEAELRATLPDESRGLGRLLDSTESIAPGLRLASRHRKHERIRMKAAPVAGTDARLGDRATRERAQATDRSSPRSPSSSRARASRPRRAGQRRSAFQS